jgi:hypothetical protein
MFECPHACCLFPHDGLHLHLFEPDQCPDCRAVDELGGTTTTRKRRKEDRR